MAISIISQPESPNIIGNTTEFVVLSNNIALANFKYVFDVYIGADLIARVKRTPAPNGRGYFDLSNIGWQNIENDGDNLESQTLPAYLMTSGFVTFELEFGEEYGTPATIYSNLASANNLYSLKGSLDYIEYVNYDPTDYVISLGGTPANLFLTNMPREVSVGLDQKQWLNFYRDAVTGGLAADDMKVITYDQAGNELGEWTINLNTIPQSSIQVVRAGVGPDQLNSYDPPTYLIDGVQPIITDDTYRYEIYIMENVGTTPLTEVFTFIIDRRCYRESRTFYFKNAFGVYESVQFNGIREQQVAISKESFTRARELGESAQTYRRFDTDLFIGRKRRFNITSNYITQEVSEWLIDLFTSYDVFVVEDGQQIAVRIVNSSYTALTRNNARLINAELTYEYTY